MKKVIFFAFFMSVTSQAAITIHKINSAGRQVTVVSDKKIVGEVGDFLEIGDRCPLEIASNHGLSARLSIEACETPELLKLGATVNNPFVNGAAPKADSSLREKIVWDSAPKEIALSRGFRFALLKSFFNGGRQIRSNQNTGRINQNLGASLGYTHVIKGDVGSNYQLAYSEFEDNAVASLRFEGSFTYGFNSNAYLLAGFNLHKFTRGLENIDVLPGFQAGVGLQFTKNYGMSMIFYQLNHRESSGNENIALNGLEFALNATFE